VDEFSIGGGRQFMETTTTTNFEHIGTWGIMGLGCHKY